MVDAVAVNPWAIELADKMGFGAEQLALKVGMLLAALFPIAAIFVYTYLVKTNKTRPNPDIM